MATPSCPDVVLLAFTAVSCVSVVHTAIRPIIPNVRPLNCAFCLALWVASGFAAHLWTLEAVWAIPIAGFLAVLAAGQWPWAFYTAVVTVESVASKSVVSESVVSESVVSESVVSESVAAVPVAEPNQPGKV